MTQYILFFKTPDGHWEQFTAMSARSARSAIRKVIEGSDEYRYGEYVAVPARSWRPVTVTVEQKAEIRFS